MKSFLNGILTYFPTLRKTAFLLYSSFFSLLATANKLCFFMQLKSFVNIYLPNMLYCVCLCNQHTTNTYKSISVRGKGGGEKMFKSGNTPGTVKEKIDNPCPKS